MRRRLDPDEVTTDLVVFQGVRYRTTKAWQAAFDKFLAGREAWSQEHDGAELPPREVNGHCPFDHSRFMAGSGGRRGTSA